MADDRVVLFRQLGFSGAAGVVLFGLLSWWANGPAAFDAVLAFIGAALVHLLQLGAGIRHLVTGVRLDLAQLKKTEIEIDKLKLDMEKTAVDIKKTSEELSRLTALVKVATPEE